MENPEWIAVDWGTSRVRAWIMGAGGQVLGHNVSDEGMGALEPDDYEDALLNLIGPYLENVVRLPVICCGMVGARQGWTEAPYAQVPCVPPGIEEAVRVSVSDERLDVRILPGISQKSPPDVMRGEETQIAGYLAGDPQFDGILCLPGTHTKWVHVSAGEIVSFRTFMTGELFALLSRQSVLRHGVSADGWDEQAFATGINRTIGTPQLLSADLFALRASGLLDGSSGAEVSAQLSGMLIGLELAGARPYWLGQRVVLIGARDLAVRYQAALGYLGADAESTDADDITLAGLRSAWDGWKESAT